MEAISTQKQEVSCTEMMQYILTLIYLVTYKEIKGYASCVFQFCVRILSFTFGIPVSSLTPHSPCVLLDTVPPRRNPGNTGMSLAVSRINFSATCICE